MDRYQDYVVKDGKFIGKFEEMYQKFDDPWLQKESLSNSYIKCITNMTVKKYNINSFLEVGCGLGGLTNYLVQSNPKTIIEGIDISETAIKKARECYPNIKFYVGNLLEYSEKDLKSSYDALLFAQIMWFILEDIDKIIENINCNFKGKLIMINQTFYKKGIQKYGNEYFSTLEEMCNYLGWECLDKIIIEDSLLDSINTHSVFRV